ncbi:MAG: hypothetical protein JSW21_13775 [Gammaproteobacteria bacterium]|nr:MAG: hypothetical protein JSW21_13775 [Gammaproteobacteria bacterium]
MSSITGRSTRDRYNINERELAMGKGILIAAMLVTACTTASANADDIRVNACHNCTDSQAKRTAEAQVSIRDRAGVYDVYIVDTPGNKLRMFRVTAEREGRTPRNYIQARTPSVEYQAYFTQSKAEWQYVRQAVKPNIILDPDFPIKSAEGVIGNEFNQTVISEQLNRHVPTRIGSLFGAALMVMRTIFTSEIVAEVQFPDGSIALFGLQRIDSLTSGHMFVYRYKPGSARDSDGNLIPDSASAFSNFQGNFTTSENMERFGRRSHIYGVDWPEGFSVRPLPSYTICARDDNGNAHCWRR